MLLAARTLVLLLFAAGVLGMAAALQAHSAISAALLSPVILVTGFALVWEP